MPSSSSRLVAAFTLAVRPLIVSHAVGFIMSITLLLFQHSFWILLDGFKFAIVDPVVGYAELNLSRKLDRNRRVIVAHHKDGKVVHTWIRRPLDHQLSDPFAGGFLYRYLQ